MKNFKKKSIQKSKMSKLIGGGQWVESSRSTKTNSEGCTETTTDSFYDKNGDGVRNAGESMTACISIDCH